MKCEKCKQQHKGVYGSGRFCSSKCARAFSTQNKRKEINESVSKKLKGKPCSGKPFKKGYDLRRKKFTLEEQLSGVQKRLENLEQQYQLLDWNDLPIAEKRRRLLNEQNELCFECGLNEWNGFKLTLELHHIDGNNKNNNKDNLQFLCPNCHSLTHNFRNKKRKAT